MAKDPNIQQIAEEQGRAWALLSEATFLRVSACISLSW